MISFIPRNKSRSGQRAGFTLVEMLVVIGIIILLVGILMPAINIAYTHAVRNRMMLDIQSISTGLEAYKNDMRTYPTLDYSDTAIMGAAYPASVLLCRALIAPGSAAQDGVAGPGFNVIPNGQVYGPYIEASRFKLVIDPKIGGTDPNNSFIADRYQHPILYFKANLAADPTATNRYVFYATTAPFPMYNLYDDMGSTTYPALLNSGPNTTQASAQKCMQLMLGDTNANGMIDGSEQPIKQPYLLWGAGPDETFGLDVQTSPVPTNPVLASRVPNVDDATNFRP